LCEKKRSYALSGSPCNVGVERSRFALHSIPVDICCGVHAAIYAFCTIAFRNTAGRATLSCQCCGTDTTRHRIAAPCWRPRVLLFLSANRFSAVYCVVPAAGDWLLRHGLLDCSTAVMRTTVSSTSRCMSASAEAQSAWTASLTRGVDSEDRRPSSVRRWAAARLDPSIAQASLQLLPYPRLSHAPACSPAILSVSSHVLMHRIVQSPLTSLQPCRRRA